ncbi:hypothetical protein VCHC48B2_2138, partial [Vibrio cholerae HC-48B2]|jgi:hypothetical protein
MRI